MALVCRMRGIAPCGLSASRVPIGGNFVGQFFSTAVFGITYAKADWRLESSGKKSGQRRRDFWRIPAVADVGPVNCGAFVLVQRNPPRVG